MATLGSVFMELKKDSKRSRTRSIAADISADVMPELLLRMKCLLQQLQQPKALGQPDNPLAVTQPVGNQHSQAPIHTVRSRSGTKEQSRPATLQQLQRQLTKIFTQQYPAAADSNLDGTAAAGPIALDAGGKLLDLETLHQLLDHLSCKQSSYRRTVTTGTASVAVWAESSDSDVIVSTAAAAEGDAVQQIAVPMTARLPVMHMMVKLSSLTCCLKQQQQPQWQPPERLMRDSSDCYATTGDSSVQVAAAAQQLLHSLGQVVPQQELAAASLQLHLLTRPATKFQQVIRGLAAVLISLLFL